MKKWIRLGIGGGRPAAFCATGCVCAAALACPGDRGALFDLAGAGTEYRIAVDQGSAQLVYEEGLPALEISAAAGEAAMVRLLPPEGAFWDLRDDAFISLHIENRGDGEIPFRMDTRSEFPWIVDPARGRGALMHPGRLHGRETRQFNGFLVRHAELNEHLYDLSAFPDMRGKPDKLVLLGWMGLDVTKMNEIAIHLPSVEHPRTVRIHRIFRYQSALSEAWLSDPDQFFPFIDRYGQYNKADWPGKIHSDGDLMDARVAEDADLSEHPWPESLNPYGGFAHGPDYGATGHFRVEKIHGRWMFIDPEGRAFWSFGVNSVGNSGAGSVWNRRHYFEWLPDEDPETERFLSGSRYDVGELNLWRKYGDDYERIYKERSLQRMRSWALNTLGGWQRVDRGQPIEGKLPYTITFNTRPLLAEKIPDPFHPDFRTGVRASLAEVPDTWDDPFCIGYFVDNELSWGVQTVFQAVLASSGTPAKERFIDGLRETYTTVENLEAAWGVSLDSFEAAGELDPDVIRAAGPGDIDAFYDRFADTYFRTIRGEIDAVAPHKLYLGCRWNNWNPRVIAAAGNYLDVFSFNLYRKEIRDHDDYGVDKPFLSTEFNFGAVDRGKFFPGLGWSSDQRNRREQAVDYVHSALDNPLCVGAHWFMWMNTVTWGRGNGENAGMGLVDDADTPYPEIRRAMREIGASLYETLGLDEEVSPPRPDPAAFSRGPVALDPATVWMEAEPAIGSYPPFEYRFEELSGNPGGPGSGWQASHVFTHCGLLPNTAYTYAVSVRDRKGRVGERSVGAPVATPPAPRPRVEIETLIDETFESAHEPRNELPPFPAYRWHANDANDWERDSSANGNSLTRVSGSKMRLGWGFDEVVARYFIEIPWDPESGYRLTGRWEIANVLDVHLGVIAGFGEYDAETGELLQRIRSGTIGETNAPFAGQTGAFALELTPGDLAAAGVHPSSYVGVFFHCDDDGNLFRRGTEWKNDVYLLDSVRLARTEPTEEPLLPGRLEIALRTDPGFPGGGRFEASVPDAQVHVRRRYILEAAATLEGPWIAVDSGAPDVSGEPAPLVLRHEPAGTSGFYRVRVEWDF